MFILERKKNVLLNKMGMENFCPKNVHVCVCFAAIFFGTFTRPIVIVLFSLTYLARFYVLPGAWILEHSCLSSNLGSAVD